MDDVAAYDGELYLPDPPEFHPRRAQETPLPATGGDNPEISSGIIFFFLL